MNADALARLGATPEGIAAAQTLLSSALRLEAMISLKHARLDRLRKEKEQVQALPGSEDAAQGIAALEKQVLTDYKALTDRRVRISALIAGVPDERHRTVLEMRYLEGMPFFRIAMKMHYDERQIYRFHAAALRHVAVQRALGLASPEENPYNKEKSL